jgi:multiple sugar transport system substrate-binding protein
MTTVRNGLVSRRAALSGLVGGLLGALAGCGDGQPGPAPTVGQTTPGPATPTPAPFLGLIPRPVAPSPTPTPLPIEVRLAYWQTGLAGDRIAEIADRFGRQNPRVIIHPEVRVFGDHLANLQQGFAAGQPPDIFVSSGAYLPEQTAAAGLLDLSGPVKDDRVNLDDYWTEPTTRPSSGRLDAVPLWTDDEVVFYNRDRFAEAGVAVPPDTWTWDDLLALATRLTEGKPGQVTRWGLLLINDIPGGWGSFVASNGGRWLNPTTGQVELGPAAAEALQWVFDAMRVHHVAPQPYEQQALTKAGQIDPFLAGKVAMLPLGTWEVPSALAQARISWDVLPLPRAPKTGHSISLSSGQPGCIARATSHPAEAWQLLRYFLSAEAQRVWVNGKVRLPSRKEVAADVTNGYAAPPPARAAVAVQALATAVDLSFVRNWQPCRAAITQALDPAFDGKLPLADAIAKATAAGNAALKGM